MLSQLPLSAPVLWANPPVYKVTLKGDISSAQSAADRLLFSKASVGHSIFLSS